MNPRALLALAALLMVLLAACEDLDPTPTPAPKPGAYAVSAIVPNPADAGQTVTVYGTLPPRPALTVGAQSVAFEAVPNGVQFTLPRDLPAATHELRLAGADGTLTASLTVRPVITGVTPQGDEVRLAGLGWTRGGALAPDVRVEFDGQAVVPRAEGASLVARVPRADVYGDVGVRVNVGGLLSNARVVKRRAASVTGRVDRAPQVLRREEAPLRARSAASTESLSLLAYAPTSRLGELREAAAALPGAHDARAIPALEAVRVTFATPAQAREALALLRTSPLARFVEFDAPVRPDGDLHALRTDDNPAVLGEQWFWPRLHVPQAWPKTQGDGVVVAVVDTGVLTTHPDLRANVLPGYDFVDNDDDPQDTVGHGTHVAGLVAANGRVKGAAPRARILPVRVLRREGGDSSAVALGVLWAAGLVSDPPNPNPARVINLSLGSADNTAALATAVRRAQERGVLIVAATGNSENGGALAYPAALPGVLAVTSVAGPVNTYQPAYANRGPGTRLAALGGNYGRDDNGDGVEDAILSTDVNDRGLAAYGLRAGTSMATPQVAGIAALALSSGASDANVASILERSATDLGVMGLDDQTGYGLVDAAFVTGGARTYVLARRGDAVVGWTTAREDGTFTLANLPPDVSLDFLAATDEDGDGRLGEAGELRSPARALVAPGDAVTALDPFVLAPSGGTPPLALP